MFYITPIVDFTYQCDNKIIAKEKMWLKEKMRNDMKFTEIKKKFFDYFREKENGAMSINTKETTQRACYTNRELSWLAFNERVLNEAANPKVPLAERFTFASIYQTNLDEFFMVRVGTLMMQMQLQEKERDNKTGMTSEEQVKAILDKVSELEKKKGRVYEQLMGELETAGIRIINFNKLSNDEGAMLEEYFDMHIAPFLSPMIIGQQQPFPFLANKQLYAIVLMKTKKGKNKIGIVPCSNSVFKRLIEIPTRPGTFMLSEELILHFVSKLYEKYEILEKSVMRVIRNADIDAGSFDDEDLDYRNMMEHMVKQRNRRNPVCVQLNRKINDKAKKKLTDYLEIGAKHLIEERTPLDMSFVFQLQNVLKNKPELFYKKRVPQPSKEISMNEKIIPQIDNDIEGTEMSFGFQSAIDVATRTIDEIHTTAASHSRVFIVEIMGHKTGWLTLHSGIAGGADIILIPEIPYNVDEVLNTIRKREKQGKKFTIIAMAEGAISDEDAKLSKKELKEKRKTYTFPSVAYQLSDELQKKAGQEVRVTIPGHVQRGGIPSASDRTLATRIGVEAAGLILRKDYGNMVCIKDGKFSKIPLEEVAGKTKMVNVDNELIRQAESLGISLGRKA